MLNRWSFKHYKIILKFFNKATSTLSNTEVAVTFTDECGQKKLKDIRIITCMLKSNKT